jgi:hypothetical protein
MGARRDRLGRRVTRIDAPTSGDLDRGQVAEVIGRVRWVNRNVYIDVGVLLHRNGTGVTLDEHAGGTQARWVPLAAIAADAAATETILRIIDRAGGDDPPVFLLDWLDVLHIDRIQTEAVDVVTLWGQARNAVEGAGR